jgi:effector-binding domain-containing protein
MNSRVDSQCIQASYAAYLRIGVQPLVKEMKNSGLVFTGESREVYHNWVDSNSNDNVIEIQFGTQE